MFRMRPETPTSGHTESGEELMGNADLWGFSFIQDQDFHIHPVWIGPNLLLIMYRNCWSNSVVLLITN